MGPILEVPYCTINFLLNYLPERFDNFQSCNRFQRVYIYCSLIQKSCKKVRYVVGEYIGFTLHLPQCCVFDVVGPDSVEGPVWEAGGVPGHGSLLGAVQLRENQRQQYQTVKGVRG